jgi:hypothetical protein
VLWREDKEGKLKYGVLKFDGMKWSGKALPRRWHFSQYLRKVREEPCSHLGEDCRIKETQVERP